MRKKERASLNSSLSRADWNQAGQFRTSITISLWPPEAKIGVPQGGQNWMTSKIETTTTGKVPRRDCMTIRDSAHEVSSLCLEISLTTYLFVCYEAQIFISRRSTRYLGSFPKASSSLCSLGVLDTVKHLGWNVQQMKQTFNQGTDCWSS